jgi:hypothetical protein
LEVFLPNLQQDKTRKTASQSDPENRQNPINQLPASQIHPKLRFLIEGVLPNLSDLSDLSDLSYLSDPSDPSTTPYPSWKSPLPALCFGA